MKFLKGRKTITFAEATRMTDVAYNLSLRHRFKLAADIYAALINKGVRSAKLAMNCGNAFMKSKEYKRALKAYKLGAKINPGYNGGRIFAKLGACYYKLKNYKNALAALEHCLQITTNDKLKKEVQMNIRHIKQFRRAKQP